MILFFLIALATQLTCTFGLVAFAPFLLIAIQRLPFHHVLWISLFCGLITDFTSTATPFPLFSISYTLVTALFFFFRHHLFHERLLALPLSTTLYSALFSLITLLGMHLSISFQSIATSLFIMPLFDAVYAFFCFTLLMVLQRRFARR